MAKRSRLRIWLLRTALGLLALSIVGFAYQRMSETRDLQRFPPPGTLVNVGDTRLHFDCRGTGSPTVILEAGAGNGSSSWQSVHAEIASETRACAYDRSGFGWSDLQPALPTRRQILDNLTSILTNAKIEGPFVLVGHSVGGLYVRDFAHEHTRDVAGIVLIDSSHENQAARMPAELLALQRDSTWWILRAMTACRIASAVGLVRVARVWSFLSPAMPDDLRTPFIAARNRSTFCPAMRGEVAEIERTLSQTEAPRDLGDTPLVVLSHGKSTPRLDAEREWEGTWAILQRELAALSRRSTHTVVENAGHAIQIDRPDVVIEAVVELVQLVRNRASASR